MLLETPRASRNTRLPRAALSAQVVRRPKDALDAGVEDAQLDG